MVPPRWEYDYYKVLLLPAVPDVLAGKLSPLISI